MKVASEYDYMIRSTYKIVPSNTLRLCIDIMNIKQSRPSPTCTKSLVSFYFIMSASYTDFQYIRRVCA